VAVEKGTNKVISVNFAVFVERKINSRFPPLGVGEYSHMNSSHTDSPPGRGCPLILTWVGSMPSSDVISDGFNALPLMRKETR
jgi:hypothetical protein